MNINIKILENIDFSGIEEKQIILNTQLGLLHIQYNEIGIIKIDFIKNEIIEKISDFTKNNYIELIQLIYNKLGVFEENELVLLLNGTQFQNKVWKNLLYIEFGTCTTYLKLALQMEMPNASRAIGTAIGQNPIAVLIPCHRVIGSNGNLIGYKWGIDRKLQLLRAEQSENILFENIKHEST